MRGKVFEAEVSAALRGIMRSESHFSSLRLLDSAGPGIRMPGDFMAFSFGTPYMLECKSSKGTSFPLKNVSQPQVLDMGGFMHSGVVCWYLFKHSCRKPRVYALSLEQWRVLSARTACRRKSVPWAEMGGMGMELYKGDGGMWDLWPLFRRD
jgi:penicillin-binding protein-related factor A (putative recombinase)